MKTIEFFTDVLAAEFPGYEPRAGQVAMAEAVERAVERGTEEEPAQAVVEAPTGTGKSVAYSVPAVLAGVHGDETKRVVIATANIALQTQLVEKDLPTIATILEKHGLPFSFAIAKGIGNYACLRNIEESDSTGLGEREAEQYRTIEEWAKVSRTGDLEELDFTPAPAVKLRVVTDSEECTGRACPKYEACFAMRARKAFRAADVIVTNYHLLYLDAVIGGGGGEGILPKYEVLVMDECFVAGTSVDGRPIEEIQVGDEVESYDEELQMLVQRRVVRRFVSKPSALVRVYVSGEEIVCTPGHPFLTPAGWKAAGSLHVDDLVLSSNYAVYSDSDELCDMWGFGRLDGDIGPHSEDKSAEQSTQEGEGLLLGSMRQRGASAFYGQARGSQLGACCEFEAHEGTEPDATGLRSSARRDDAQSNRSPTIAEKRERNRAYGTAGDALNAAGFGLGSGARGTTGQEITGEADALQDRHRQSSAEDRDRGRRFESQGASATSSGRAQGCDAPLARVERVEVLEPGSDGRYGGVCPDGLVYNLEVEGTHTYTVGSGLIVHNCHKAGDVARDYFGFQLSRGAVTRSTRLLKPRSGRKRLPVIDAELYQEISDEADRLWKGLEAVRRSRSYKARLRQQGLVRSERLEELLDQASTTFASEAQRSQDREYKAKLQKASDRCAVQKIWLKAARLLEQPDVQVYHLDQQKTGAITLASKLIDVGPTLRACFWEKVPACVITSATLCDGASSFELINRELGIPQTAERLQVESPFDHERVLMVLPANLPDPKSDGFARAVADELVRVTQSAGGRTLALFTSYRVLEAAHRVMTSERRPFQVMRQGDAPRMELVRRFKADVSSVLLGTESFWAGVDVPGESLSVVFIDKLPFVTPEDPVLDAINERDPKGSFFKWSLPRAVVQFRQGAGRLMRARTDYGAIVCCDRRLTQSGYGSRFLNSLPAGMAASESSDDIGEWLAEHAAIARAG